MELILKVLGAGLGILVPFIFMCTLRKGVENAPFEAQQKAGYKKTLVTVTLLWTALVWVLSLAGIFSYHVGDAIPRFVIPLVLPVLVGLFMLTNKTFQTILDHTPLSTLVGAQTFRLAGMVLLVIAYLGILPSAFASGGYGDIATGSLALIAWLMLSKQTSGSKLFFWLFNIVGLCDLLNVAYLLLAYYPLYNSSLPSSAAAADFSLVMLPAIAAPIALLLHFYSLRNYLLKKI